MLRRRLRVTTVSLGVATTPLQLYTSCDAAATTLVLMHKVGLGGWQGLRRSRMHICMWGGRGGRELLPHFFVCGGFTACQTVTL